MNIVTLTEAEACARLIRRGDLVASKLAFIDCKIPGSHLKENYAIIGPGVSQDAAQVIPLAEPHGFQIGAAAMPNGITNNLHIHFTAEVFIIFRGTWLFRWGADGRDGEIVGEAGDVVSVPTWIFRGFTNIGVDDGWIYTMLGGDDTGGIIWHPSILDVARQHGMYLSRENMLIDTSGGAPTPTEAELIRPIPPSAIAGLRKYSVDDMRSRVVTAAERQWSSRALLDSMLPGHASALAPVLGYGMTEDRDQAPKVANPHGFSIEWLRIEPGNSVGAYAVDAKQVLMVYGGAAEVTLNEDGGVRVRAEAWDSYSVPANVWRSIAAVGDVALELVVMTAGDARPKLRWSPNVARAAADAGWVLDASGFMAARDLVPQALMAAE